MLWFSVALAPAGAGLAQAPAPLARPDLDLVRDGVVTAILRLPDGGTVIGGEFKSINGTPRRNIAKLRSDDTLDPDWNPSADAVVYALAVDAAGNLYAGGMFRNIGGQARRGIARLAGNGAGTVDPVWNPPGTEAVLSIAVGATGDVYAGGYSVAAPGATPRGYLAKYSGSGSGAVDAAWNPAPSHDVTSLVLDATGTLYVGGSFASIGGQARSWLARLASTGTGAVDTGWNPMVNGRVNELDMDGTGRLYLGGSFTSVGGLPRNRIARISASGSVDPDWNPSPNSSVFTLDVDAAGDIYVGGFFTEIGGLPRPRIARVSADGAVDPQWNPASTLNVGAIFSDSVDKVYVGGTFTRLGGQHRLGFAVVSADGVGAAGPALDAEATPYVETLAQLPDGGIVVGGWFEKADGLPRSGLLRLRPDGTLDPDWNPMADDRVYAVAVDAAGDVYVGGTFDNVGGLPRRNIAKVSGAGTVDADWNPTADSLVTTLAVDNAGNLFAAGYFEQIGGQARSGLAKISGSGTGVVDPVWNPAPDDLVDALIVDADGSLFAGGSFRRIGGQSSAYLVKLAGDGTGAVDTLWDPPLTGNVSALAIGPAGDLYAGGNFLVQIGTRLQSHLVKLARTGTGAPDPSWNPRPDASILRIATDTDGNVFFSSWRMTSVGGVPRLSIAKVSGADTGAVDPVWNPSASDRVDAMTCTPDGRLWVGGAFATVGGQARAKLAALPTVLRDTIFGDGFEPASNGTSY